MKIDRLLSIIVYLLNRDLVSARELADKYGVSVRTIQRDMEAIDLAGIPIISVQGPNGGYSIMDTFKLDRQFVTADDLFYIITSLSSISSSLTDRRIGETVEKMKSLLSEKEDADLEEKHRKLFVDFSMLSGHQDPSNVFGIIEKALNQNRLLKISYTSNKLETSERVLEPMTIVFKWRSWYLFAFCRLRGDYRLFRISRIREPVLMDRHFRRREKTIEEYLKESKQREPKNMTDLVLAFDSAMQPLVEEYFRDNISERDDKGRFIVHMKMPEDGWLYGMILSYGAFVEVLSPLRIRKIITETAEKIHSLYTSTT